MSKSLIRLPDCQNFYWVLLGFCQLLFERDGFFSRVPSYRVMSPVAEFEPMMGTHLN